jgi:hypothetical protein
MMQTYSSIELRRGRPGAGWRHLGLFFLLLLTLAASTLCGRAAQASALPQLDEVAATNSVFIDDGKFGKDPFFPASTRRAPKVITPVNPTSDFSQILNNVSLKGISGRPGKRLALLGNRTVGTGEEIEVKVGNQIMRVICLEIREKSVVLALPGGTEKKEIHFRSGM